MHFDYSLARIPDVDPRKVMLWGGEHSLTLLEQSCQLKSVKKLEKNKLVQLNLLDGLIEWE